MKRLFLFTLIALMHETQASKNTSVIEGQPFHLIYTTLSRAADCRFDFPGIVDEPLTPTSTPQPNSARPDPTWNYTLYSPNGECGVLISSAHEKDEGRWTVKLDSDSYQYVTVFVPPKKVERAYPTTDVPLTAGKNSTFTCRATAARPVPHVSWRLDGELMTNGKQVVTPNGERLFDVEDSIVINGQANHDGKILRCLYTSEAITSETAKNYLADFNLTVHSAPDPITGTVDYPSGTLILGQEATVRLQFRSNPDAVTYSWFMHDLVAPVNVNSSASGIGKSLQAGRYTFLPIQKDSNNYWADVTIDELLESDLNVKSFLQVTNRLGSGNFTLQIENAEVVGLSSGIIAGIVIGVILLVVLVAAAVYFVIKKKGKKKRSKKIQPTPQARSKGNTGEMQERNV